MTPEWERDAEVLGRRYQRLLAWYPPRHRAAHGEEMLGVLLAAAPEGQRRPRLTEAVNLLRGGLLIWLHPRPAAQATSGWSDALAVFSVAAPLALALQYSASMTASGLSVSARGGVLAVLIGLAFSGLTLALPFVVLGLRRTAGFICCAAALLLALIAGNAVYVDLLEGGVGGSVVAVIFFSYATEAGALLGSPGPRRGWRILSWRGWLLIGVAATAAGFLQGAISMARPVALPREPVPAASPREHCGLAGPGLGRRGRDRRDRRGRGAPIGTGRAPPGAVRNPGVALAGDQDLVRPRESGRGRAGDLCTGADPGRPGAHAHPPGPPVRPRRRPAGLGPERAGRAASVGDLGPAVPALPASGPALAPPPLGPGPPAVPASARARPSDPGSGPGGPGPPGLGPARPPPPALSPGPPGPRPGPGPWPLAHQLAKSLYR